MNEAKQWDEVVAFAERVFGDARAANLWLTRPKHRLDELSPFEMLSREGGCERVIEMLGQIEHGIFA